MRKYITLVASFLFLVIINPANVLAEEQTKDMNELGIKDGTEVYGEDISELSEEELQYIPKGWRDGEFNSRHEIEGEGDNKPAERKQTFSIMSRYPDVNNYINSIHPVKVKKRP